MNIVVSLDPEEQHSADQLLGRLIQGEQVTVVPSNEPIVALLVNHGLADAFGGRVVVTAKGRDAGGHIFRAPR